MYNRKYLFKYCNVLEKTKCSKISKINILCNHHLPALSKLQSGSKYAGKYSPPSAPFSTP